MPVLAQHGAFGSAVTFSGPTILGQKKLSLKLVDEGFDIWFGNNRGTEYSNSHVDDATQSLAEHWDFTWADFGAHDLPAFVEKILQVTGKPKVTLFGYS